MSLRGAGCVLVDKSDEETVEEETQVEQTSAASLAWVLDTCAEAVVELTDARRRLGRASSPTPRRSSTGATRSRTPSPREA